MDAQFRLSNPYNNRVIKGVSLSPSGATCPVYPVKKACKASGKYSYTAVQQ